MTGKSRSIKQSARATSDLGKANGDVVVDVVKLQQQQQQQQQQSGPKEKEVVELHSFSKDEPEPEEKLTPEDEARVEQFMQKQRAEKAAAKQAAAKQDDVKSSSKKKSKKSKSHALSDQEIAIVQANEQARAQAAEDRRIKREENKAACIKHSKAGFGYITRSIGTVGATTLLAAGAEALTNSTQYVVGEKDESYLSLARSMVPFAAYSALGYGVEKGTTFGRTPYQDEAGEFVYGPTGGNWSRALSLVSGASIGYVVTKYFVAPLVEAQCFLKETHDLYVASAAAAITVAATKVTEQVANLTVAGAKALAASRCAQKVSSCASSLFSLNRCRKAGMDSALKQQFISDQERDEDNQSNGSRPGSRSGSGNQG